MRGEHLALAGLLAGTALLHLWNLSSSGYANSFYAAAVQAGSQSWKALLFGSLDAGNAITVDKPPASLWIMGLSARIFGFDSWSLLAPQALMGVASAGLLYATVRRRFGPAAGLIAGATLALTPVAVLMFRFDNPDALLVLLLVVAAWAVVRATETASLRWLVLCGAAIGFAFLTKMLQGFLVLPGFALVYLLAAPAGWWRRTWHLLVAGLTVVVSAGWFIALVEIWPKDSRPFIGGSENDSLLELALGYNGLGRIFGGSGNGGGGGMGGGGNTGFGGSPGITRLFGDSMGTEISWMLPAALIALVAGLWFTRRAPRTDGTRAQLLVWGTWLLVTGAVFSFMSGTMHPYYTVALAPAIAALTGIGTVQLWRGRDGLAARSALALMAFSTGVWSFVLLSRDPSWLPWLRWVVLAAGVVTAIGLVAGAARLKRVAVVLVLTGVLTGTGGTAAWAVATAGQPHSGSIPTSGPSGSGMGGTGMGGGRSNSDSSGTDTPPGASQEAPGADVTGGGATDGTQGGDRADGGQALGGLGTGGGQTGAELTALLTGTGTTWSAAVNGSQSAAELELATGTAVIAIGGWSSSDDSPTLAEFQEYVARGEIAYYVSGGGMGGGPGGGDGGESAASQIAAWVSENFTATTVGSSTVYALTDG
ncbi:4-amino-4-deoxy-L-arabinose transferase-like glycosyltransferase [Catenuloplanes nepalensis]|uniref:4-amino-4-deoxy-L-arabinose transferase-like glycosyltransferase n=1 Tax=Catenuloplanes nepalensis TaxID=587533 RepID=A0ABT9N2H5_9ACTN|nr:glycosyltransferase family 39 protein [Catenuloplanes nepalensis]MDP9797899.1 4-amino-4-deoxy-L-arabinose transferase-like glycosyltransferase [Catenuloplanes nepalensis]